jgi:aarF domain-containing kinase
MIFDHNFVHGDIHPGNILFTKEEKGVEPKMVLLDTGIARRFTKHDHEILVGVLTSFINGSGKKAAEYLIKDSLKSQSTPPVGVAGFTKVLDDMCEKAKADQSFFDSIGNYVSTICNAAAKHQIMMNQGFVSIALTVRVMEGVALALNKEAEIVTIANGIILKAKAKSFLGKNVYDN